MIESGVKTEEYRDTKEYYETRLRNWHSKMWPGFAVVEFRRGYSKNAKRMAFYAMRVDTGDPNERCHYEIRRRCLHPDWGEPNDWHYVIKLGERVELS